MKPSKIKKITKKDLSGIGNLIIEEFNKPPYNDGWTKTSVKKMLNNYFRIGYGFVALNNGEIVGAIIVRDDPYSQGLYLVIEELVVRSDMQGQGVGKKLVRAIEKVAKNKKAHTIYFYTHKKSKAVKFYKKLGYKQSKGMIAMGKKLK